MLRALWTAASGMNAQQLNVDTIANNLANVNTNGFKKTRADFQDVLYQTERVPGTASAQGAQVPTGIQVGLGVRPAATSRLHTQGTLQWTGDGYNMAIEGHGFFQILMPDGTTAYTRDGAFRRDTDGRLVTADGYPLDPEITIPGEAKEFSIGNDGTVQYTLPGQTEPQQAGTIQLASFVNPAGLMSIGRNLLTATAASGEPVTGQAGTQQFGTVAQNYLEQSNVDVVHEMVAMIVAMRAYEVNSKSIQTSDEMLQIANQVRR